MLLRLLTAALLFADLSVTPRHDDALRRAQVWTPPSVPIEAAKLGDNPPGPGALPTSATVECRFKPEGMSGTTPKFDCELPGGDKVKVKYGAANPEVYTEVAATRLLSALGFPTDRMYVVAAVRCYGCPPDPLKVLECANEGRPVETCFPEMDYSKVETFDPVVIERPVKGRRIETGKTRGWKWEELASIDPAAGGAPREQVDAFRLMAVFLGHWDNKDKNQRLLCLGSRDSAGDCRQPLAMVQDLGGTFGPEKLNLRNWEAMPIWTDRATCTVSMKQLPYGGSTFPDTRISEAGRRFLAARLKKLSARQIRELFDGARFAAYPHPDPAGADIGNWVRAFEKKVREIADGEPCGAES